MVLPSLSMSRKKRIDMRGVKEKQVTPKGVTIPVPKRAAFFGDLDKAATPRLEPAPDGAATDSKPSR